MRVRRWLATPALVLAAAGAAYATDTTPNGPDVSSYQHPHNAAIDWTRVHAAGAGFAFVKATEGTSYTNPYFARDYQAAAQQQLVRSAYHYARPEADPTAQADFFVHTVGATAQPGDLPLTLDLEETGGLSPSRLAGWATTFLDRVEALTSRKPIIYTYPWFWRHSMADSHAFTGYPLWIASYTHGSSPGALPGGWSTWTFWQTTSQAHEPGIPAVVDMNRFNGDAAALRQLATPPGPSPGPLLPALPRVP